MAELAHTGEKVCRGIPISGGVARGKLVVLPTPVEREVPKYQVSDAEVADQIGRLEQALIQTRRQILDVQNKVREAIGTDGASIFDAHMLALDDPMLWDEVVRVVREEHTNVEFAFSVVSAKFVDTFSRFPDDYLRERAADLRDVSARVMHNLLGLEHPMQLAELHEQSIIVAHDLNPSQTATLDRNLVLGFAIDRGSKTCHTAILARSLQIPAVAGLMDASLVLRSGQYALLDGINGLVIINPTDQTLFEYGQVTRRHDALQVRLRDIKDLPAVTLDGERVILSANVESPDETDNVQANGAEGVGLFRTEYLFLNRATQPSEEEQFQAYWKVASALHPQPVVIRTLDLGGDKVFTGGQAPDERNPFLGWRAIRMCLQERDLFRNQLRAILRASTLGNIKMMYPMISGIDEVVQANALVEEYKAELRSENIPFDENLEIGVMVEIPSAAMTADALAKRAKFFSLGTNDLIQYSLGVDRMNPKIAHLYEPTHPAIVRLIRKTVESAAANKIWVGVCGEMAADPVMVPLLLGLGVKELSVAPALVPPVKLIIRRLKMPEAEVLAKFALGCESGTEILKEAQALVRRVAPELLEENA